jgi:glycosyltransferase involved in cell wall biosynthesis
MSAPPLPHVTIVTPVYNGEQFLAECIESVLRQTYTEWQYIIVDNCSTDSTVEIATRYAPMERRIQVITCTEFVSVMESHNRGLKLVPEKSKYCKVLAADDWLYPEFLERMVEFAEAHPDVGVVGGYMLSGSEASCKLKYDSLSYRKAVVPGHEACRWHLLHLGRDYFGVPTSLLYRAELVRKTDSFFPNLREHSDVSSFYECLREWDLGFLHQVLSFERIHEKALSTKARRVSSYAGSRLIDLCQYGPAYLTPAEFGVRKREALQEHYWLIAVGLVNFQGKRFWEYHKAVLKECGSPVSMLRLSSTVLVKLLDMMLEPKVTLEKIFRRYKTRVAIQEERRV